MQDVEGRAPGADYSSLDPRLTQSVAPGQVLSLSEPQFPCGVDNRVFLRAVLAWMCGCIRPGCESHQLTRKEDLPDVMKLKLQCPGPLLQAPAEKPSLGALCALVATFSICSLVFLIPSTAEPGSYYYPHWHRLGNWGAQGFHNLPKGMRWGFEPVPRSGGCILSFCLDSIG